MRCQWTKLLSILPDWMKGEIDRIGKESMQELRLRLSFPPEMISGTGSIFLSGTVLEADLRFCVNTASRYSPWAASTISHGFLTAPGGHRIGLCGEVVTVNGQISGIRNITSLCIRVAREIPGIAAGLPVSGSILILGAPGWGKTTLLRDLVRRDSEQGSHICVVDERGELFPDHFQAGSRTDVMTGCTKAEGIPMLLRTMCPDCIAMDEITEPEDTAALLQAAGCGVRMIATAHAGSLEDFHRRPVYQPIWENKIFQNVVILRPNKTWYLERMA